MFPLMKTFAIIGLLLVNVCWTKNYLVEVEDGKSKQDEALELPRTFARRGMDMNENTAFHFSKCNYHNQCHLCTPKCATKKRMGKGCKKWQVISFYSTG